MKKIVYIVLALVIIAGAIIIPTIGFNKDLTYSKHTEIKVLLGKEYNKNEIIEIVKEVIPNEKFKISEVEVFGDAFIIKTKKISNEQLDNLKQKISEKYQIEDMSNIISTSKVGNTRIRDIIKPYRVPASIVTLIIVAYIGIRYNKLGLANVIITELVTLIMSELVFVCIMAITRCPVNRLFVPAVISVYTAVVIITNVFFEKTLKQIEQKSENNKKA